VILFDEIEKAHPDVFNILLQILDDGRLTDSQGRTVDFRNTVIIMTSNLGSTYLSGVGTERQEDTRRKVMDALRDNFRPEFLNRIDEVIIFHALTKQHIGEIVQIQLDQVADRLKERRITIALTPRARDLVATLGYDPVFGARPLKRVIQKQLLDPIAMGLLTGELHDGEEIRIDVDNGALVFSGAMSQAPLVA
jgi:ATP-dependent Clp protease ATP-binding subunit ClpB